MAFIDWQSRYSDFDTPGAVWDCVNENYLRVAQDFLPPGKAWTRRPDATLSKLLAGLALEYSRVGKRAADLLVEMDPLFAVELLPDWEEALGLPRCPPDGEQSLAARQQAARDALVGLTRSPSKQFFLDLGLGLGFADITIEVFGEDLFKANSLCNDILYGPGWAFSWKVNATEIDPATDALLMCTFEFWKPLHTWIWWNLTP